MSCYHCKHAYRRGMMSGGIYYTDVMEDRALILPELFRAVEEYTVTQYTTVERLKDIQEVKHEVYCVKHIKTYNLRSKLF